MGLLGCCRWLVEVCASAAGEGSTRRDLVEMHAGAARVRSTRGSLVEMRAGAARVRSTRGSALVLRHVCPISRRGTGAGERRRSLGQGFADLLGVETARRAGALVLVCEGRSLRRVVRLSSHGGSVLHPLLGRQALALLVAGRAATGSPCNTLISAMASRLVTIGYTAKVGLPVVFDRTDAARCHAS